MNVYIISLRESYSNGVEVLEACASLAAATDWVQQHTKGAETKWLEALELDQDIKNIVNAWERFDLDTTSLIHESSREWSMQIQSEREPLETLIIQEFNVYGA